MAGKLDYIQLEPIEMIQAIVTDLFNSLEENTEIKWPNIFDDMYDNIYQNKGIVEIISFGLKEKGNG
jgi:hypothetical protein